MAMSLKLKLNLLFLLAVLIVLVSSVSAAVYIFREEIASLYRNDLNERLRLVETDYSDSDAVSSASEDVSVIQEEVLEALNEKYLQLGENDLSPFIVNGDAQIILSLDDTALKEILAADGKSRLLNGQSGEFLIDTSGGTQWVIYSYFEDWDWYTGYVLENSLRLASLWRFTRQITLIILGLSLFLFLIITLMTGSLVKRMRRISDHTNRILTGDLEQRLTIDRMDEVGSLAENFNSFTDHLMGIISGIRLSRDESSKIHEELSEVISRTASLMENIDSQTSGISQGMKELNQKIHESGASLGSISGQVDDLNSKADTQVSTVQDSSELINQVGTELNELSRNFSVQKEYSDSLISLAKDGKSNLSETNRIIQDMNDNVSDIVGLVGMIQDIAAQTNLLAMNAAIEAAHAGDAGRGFAVVADEIRKLATQSSESSKSIEERINSIVSRAQDANDAGLRTEDSFSSILTGIDDLSESLEKADRSAEHMTGHFKKLDSSIRDLSLSAEDVKTAAEKTENEIPVISEGFKRLEHIGEDVMASISRIDESASRQVQNISLASRTLDLLQGTIDTLKKQISIFTEENH
ncbi:MAG: methyl-accepting chemotaxis protein [Spirochaetales bacterium]|nr:methyl-accepting chemotaxis protein [Spirochaetales bacterium]